MFRTLLFDPNAFFADNPWADDFMAAVGAVAVVAVFAVVNLLLMGVVLAWKIDATTTQNGRTVSFDSILWDVLVGQLFLVFFSMFIGWVIVAGMVHIGSKLADGDGNFTDSLTVTAWGMVPTIFTAFLATASVFIALQGELTVTSIGQLTALVSRLEGGAGIFGIVVPLISAVWQGYIWSFGIKHVHSLKLDTAMGVAGIIAVIFFIFSVI
ncbi:Yip1 family protein [Haladaptatus sp. ZSTT2]|uniref:Yip1 family protein n=1 Tax=Haladaptatus sp. ZSTT2 TaxID=3120515 RepID=UPI00300E83A0